MHICKYMHTCKYMHMGVGPCPCLCPCMPMCTHVHTHVLTPHAQFHKGLCLKGASSCSLGKPILRLLGNTEEERSLDPLPFPSWIQIPTQPRCPSRLSTSFPFLLVTTGLLLLALHGEEGGSQGSGGPLGSATCTGPGSRAAQQCSGWKQLRLTVAIDYGKIVCG